MTGLPPASRQPSRSRNCEEIAQRIDNPLESGYERFVGLEHLESGATSIRNWGRTADVTSSMKLFRAGDTIVARRNVYLRRAARADFDGVCSGDGIVLRPSGTACHPDLLPYLLNTDVFWDYVASQADGTMSKRITATRLMAFEFMLPPPAVQSTIACVLNSAKRLENTLIEASTRGAALSRSLRQHLFSNGIGGRAKRTSARGLIPDSWTVRPMRDVFDFLDSRRVPLKQSDRQHRQGSYPYYGASGPIDSVDDYIFDEETLLLAEDGMNLVFRNSPIVYKATGKYWVNNHAHVLRPRSGYDLDFYHVYLEHLNFQPYVTGTYQKKITQGDCENIPVVCPPLSEQREIIHVVAQFDRGSAALEQRQAALRGLVGHFVTTELV